MARPYSGPFDTPPDNLLGGAIGWRFTKRYTDDRWFPTGWEIVYPDGILTVGLDGTPIRDSVLFPA